MDSDSQAEQSSDESGNDSDNERLFKRDVISAIEKNHFKALEKLFGNVKHPVSEYVNTRDSTDKNNTLLHIAVRARKRKLQKDNTKIIQLLVQKGASIEAKNDSGETPYEFLSKKRSKTVPQNIDWISVEQILAHPTVGCSKRNYSQLGPSNQSQPSKKRKTGPNDDVMETEEFSFINNPKYRASGLKRNLHGTIYQLQILLIFLHRATKLHELIYLATEMDEAEKFDDMVLRYKNVKENDQWTSRFVQVKHLLDEENRIKKTELFSKAKQAKFRLDKYYDSFCKILEKSYFQNDILEEFSICTNACFAEDAERYFVEDVQFVNDDIMYFNNHAMRKYKLRQDFNESLGGDNKHLKLFIEKFRFIVNYPDRHRINMLISQEMGEDFGLLNSDLACNTFKNDVWNWFESYSNRHSEFLLIKDGKGFLKGIKDRIRLLMMTGLSLAYPDELNMYPAKFATFPNQFLQCKRSKILILKSEAPLLTSIKVNQHLHQTNMYRWKDNVIFVQLKTLGFKNIWSLVYSAFSNRETFNLLIIDCGLNSEMQLTQHKLNDIALKLLEILCEVAAKQLILISNPEHFLSKKLTNENSSVPYEEIDDPNSYSDLTAPSKTAILNFPIYFQGKKLELKNIINVYSATWLLNNSSLVDILRGREIRVDDLTCSDGFVSDDYVSRTLSNQIISTEVLRNEEFIQLNITVVSKVDRQTMLELGVEAKYITVWTTHEAPIHNGIVLIPNDLRANDIQKYLIKKTVYFLEYFNDGKFIWTHFIGDGQPMRRFIDEQAAPNAIEEAQLINLENRCNIVAADPGYGKSFLMSNLHKELLSSNPFAWIKRINLNDHVIPIKNSSKKILGDIDFSETQTESAVRFLADMLFIEGHFQRHLFELSLRVPLKDHKYPEIVLLFDGFDEISPKYKQQTLVLLKALWQSGIKQLWVTTRTHEKSSLEDALNSAALHLNPFTPQQKYEYLENYRKVDSNKKVYSHLCSCLNDINLNSNNSEDHRQAPEDHLREALRAEFTNVPLHLRMLAEVGFRVTNLNIPNLYKEFVRIKFNIYYDEKSSTSSKAQADDEIRKRDLRNLSDDHASLAFELLFPDSAEEMLPFDKHQEYARIGFIVVNERGVHFTHRSFAEYFITLYMAKYIKTQKIQTILWDSVLVVPHYKLIRSFVNENEPMLSNLTAISSCREKIMQIRSINYFEFPFKEKLDNIVRVCLILLRQSGNSVLEDIKQDIFYNYHKFDKRRETDRKLSICLSLLLYDEQLFNIIFPAIMGSYKLHNSCAIKCSALHIVFRHYTGSDITNLLDRLVHQLNVEEICFESCENLLHIAATRGKFDYILQLLVWAKRNNFYDQELFIKLLHEENFYGNTFFHIVQYHESFDRFLAYLFREFGATVLKGLIEKTDSCGSTILHICVKKCQSDTLRALLKEFKNNFNPATVKYLILKADEVGKTAFHYHTKKQASENSPFRLLLEFSISQMLPLMFKELVSTTDSKGKSIFFKSIKYQQDLERILNHLLINLSLQDIKLVVLSHTDYEQRTVLHSAVKGENSSNSLLTLLEFIELNFGRDCLKKILFAKDIRGMTVIHRSCYNLNKRPIIKELLKFTCQALSANDFHAFVFGPDLEGKTILHHASCCFISRNIVATLESMKEYFGISTLEHIVLEKDHNGQTILHNAASANFPCETIQALLQYVKNELDITIFIRLIANKNNRGKTAFEILFVEKNQLPAALDAFSTSYNWLISILNTSSELRRNNTGRSFNIYWSELDSIYAYSTLCGNLEKELCDKLHPVYNHSAWKETGDNEWLLELDYNTT